MHGTLIIRAAMDANLCNYNHNRICIFPPHTFSSQLLPFGALAISANLVAMVDEGANKEPRSK
jgi:hypothetical protein